MALAITEVFSFGGVDSRSNAINFPPNRAVRVRNFLLTRDGHLRLRDGYSELFGATLPDRWDYIPTPSIVESETPCDFFEQNLYFVLVKETSDGMMVTTEFGPIDCGGTKLLSFNVGSDLPGFGEGEFGAGEYGGSSDFAWRIYSGTLSGNYEYYRRFTYDEASAVNFVLPLSTRGQAIPSGSPAHSMISYKTLTGDRSVIFAEGTHLYLLNLRTGDISEPPVFGTHLAGTGRWTWALASNRLYGTNGVDRKYFDGQIWRDIGLAPLNTVIPPDLLKTGSPPIQYLNRTTTTDYRPSSYTATNGGYANPSKVSDTSETTYAEGINGDDARGETWKGFPSHVLPTGATVNLTILSEVVSRTGTSACSLRYTNDNGQNWYDIYIASAVRAKQTDVILLDAGQDISKIQIRAEVHPGEGGRIVHHIHEIYIEEVIPLPPTEIVPVQPDGITVSEGTRELTEAEAEAVVVSVTAGAGTFLADDIGRLAYVAFCPDGGMWGPATIPVGDGTRTKAVADKGIQLTVLPTNTGQGSKFIALTGDGEANAYFCSNLEKAVTKIATGDSYCAVTAVGHGLTTGDHVGFKGTGYGPLDGQILKATVIDADTISVPVPLPTQTYFPTDATLDRLIKIAEGTATATITAPKFYTGVIANQLRGLPPGSPDLSPDRRGYQFYLALFNPTAGGHVGNRVAIGYRISPLTRCLINIRCSSGVITFLRPLIVRPRPPAPGWIGANFDSEWELLVGRTADGAEVPYALQDEAGNWVYISPENFAAVVTGGTIDGGSELPTRNGLPPTTMAAIARVGNYLYGIVSDGPWVYRSEPGVDDTDGHVGRPEQSWAGMCETFPTGEIPRGVHGFNGDCWVQSLEDLAILVDQEGVPAWQGPWQGAGIAGQDAFCVSWKGLPYWLSGHKQLQTMTAEGPIPISDEYEAALLSKIGDAYLSEVQLIPYREAELQLEWLVIKGRDVDGKPLIVIHDFNTRDDRSPWGQAVEAQYGNVLANDFYVANVRDNQSCSRLWAGGANGHLYQLIHGLTDNGEEFTADLIGLPYVGPQRTVVKIIEWYGDSTVQWYVSSTLDKTDDISKFDNLTDYDPEEVPGDEDNPHYRVQLPAPEMIHAYLWIRLESHSADAPPQGMKLSSPPHCPLETYGRIYMVSPLTATSRGK